MSIDGDKKHVTLQDMQSKKSEVIAFDVLVLALGVSFDPSRVPGLLRSCELGIFHNICSLKDTLRLKTRINEMRAGESILCVVTGMPYKCPPAPFEIVLLIDEMLRRRGLRSKIGAIDSADDAHRYVRIALAFPKPFPFAGPFPHVHAPFVKTCEQRGIRLLRNHKVTSVEQSSASKKMATVKFTVLGSRESDKIVVKNCDLLLGTLPQRAPDILGDVATKTVGGFVPAHTGTCELIERHDGSTYVVGDCGHFTLNLVKTMRDGTKKTLQKPHPKSGHFAYQQALVVAKQIDGRIRRGISIDEARKIVIAERREGQCYAESGYGEALGLRAVLIPGDGSDPYFEATLPSRSNAAGKAAWIRGHINRMFKGIDTSFLDETDSTCASNADEGIVDELQGRLAAAGALHVDIASGVPEAMDFTKILRRPAKKEADLADFGYRLPDPKLSSAGVVSKSSDAFSFRWRGQMHYNGITKAVIKEIQLRMDAAGLKRAQIEEDGTTIWHTENHDQASTLFVVIQGSGAVRAGMWANSVAINANVEAGTMLRAISCAKSREWGIVILNPNAPALAGPDACTAHTIRVWDRFVAKSKASCAGRVVMIAHSNGGRCTMGLLQHRTKSVISAVAGIAFTDAVHWQCAEPFHLDDRVREFLKTRTCDWVASKKPLDTKLNYACAEKNPKKAFAEYCTPYRGHGRGDPIPLRSAGHTKHVWTTACALDSALAHLENCLSGGK
eukprot:g2231.t1